MPLRRLRFGFGVFFALVGLFGANLLAFQNGASKFASKRIVFPGSEASEGQAAPPAGVTVAAPALDLRPALPAATPLAQAGVTTGSVSEPDLVRAIQRELQVLGYAAGGVDGVAGLTTRAAIMAFEWDEGLPLTAEPGQKTLQTLLLGSGRGGAAGASAAVPPAPDAAQVIRSVQQGLAALGVGNLRVTGTLTAETQRSIRLFEVREGLPETGRVSGSLAARIVRLTGEKRLADRR
jgi:peptidoglycan hydrolase-like protein with peptidoglycan-binding domain